MLMMEGGEGRPSVAGSRGLGRKHGPGEWKWAREDKGKICSDRKGERGQQTPHSLVRRAAGGQKRGKGIHRERGGKVRRTSGVAKPVGAIQWVKG